MSKHKSELPKIEHPPALRLLLWLGRPFGLDFVPEDHVRAIYRMGQYAGVRGPGLFYYNRFTESLGPIVNTGGHVKDCAFENILSRDVVPVSINLTATVAYDPSLGEELAHVLTRFPYNAYGEIAKTYIRWALMTIANQYTAVELTQHAVRAAIEDAARDKVNEEIRFLGIQIVGKLRITGVELPQRLAERHELIAQRRANILSGTEYHPAEYRRALVSEVIEQLAQSAERESFVNFSEMLGQYAEQRREALPPPPNLVELPLPRAEETPPTPPPASEEEPRQPPPRREDPPPPRREDPRPPRRKSRL